MTLATAPREDVQARVRRRAIPVWLQVTAVGVVIAALGVVIASFFVTRSGFATVDNQAVLQERSDCARAINAEQQQLKDARDNAIAVLLQVATAAQLTVPGTPERAAAAVRLGQANQQLDATIAAVSALPPLDIEVERRCPGV